MYIIYRKILAILFPPKKLTKDDKVLLKEEENLIQHLKENTKPSKPIIGIFRIQNLLNEVYGLIEPHVQEKNIEFLYDIHESVPIEIVGNILALEQILYNLLSTILENQSNSTIVITFKKINKNLVIEVINKHIVDQKVINENAINIKTSKQLIGEMHGTFSIVTGQSNTIYKVIIPFLTHELYQESYYQLSPHIIAKKILLIEDHPAASNILGDMLRQFKINVTIENSDSLPSIRNFEEFDMLILNAKKMTPLLMAHLQEVKEKHDLKIISLETLHGWQRDRRQQSNTLVNKYLYKPLSRGMVLGLLHDIFVLKSDENLVLNENSKQENIHRTGKIVCIEESLNITPESFKDFGYKHILVVEDNIINQKIIQSLLDKSHIKITLANNGQEALDILAEDSSLNLIIMDINMPIMDGYQATKYIRKNNALSHLPIIIISGLGFANEIEEMYLVGADAHLTKPFKIGELYTALKLFINQSDKKEAIAILPSEYIEDIAILNTEKAIEKMQNVQYYRDSLQEVLFFFRYSDDIIKEHIIRHEYNELRRYCKKLFQYTKSIEAKSLNRLLNEMIILIKNEEGILLQQYITLYHDEWIKTQRYMKQYLKSVELH